MVVSTLVAGIAAGLFVPFSVWGTLSQELSIFFGLLGAALPQAMTLTIQAQPSKTLTVSEAAEFAERLRKQQVYWFGLFVLCGFGILILLGGKLLASEDLLGEKMVIPFATWFPDWWPLEYRLGGVSVAPLFSALIAAQITLLGCNLVGLGRGIISLQTLRGGALQREAQQAVKSRLDAEQATATPFRAPDGYGDVVRPGPKKRKAG